VKTKLCVKLATERNKSRK